VRTRTGSLRRRLAAVVAGAVAVVVVLVAVLTWFVVASQLHSALDTSLDREATRVQRLIQANADWTGEGSGGCAYAVEPACVRRIDTSEPVGAGSGPLTVTEQAHAVATRESARARYTADGVRVAVVPTRTGEAVMVGVPTRQTETALTRTAIALAVAGAIGIVLAAALGYVVATVGLRPVRALDTAVRRVRDTADPHERVDVHRNDELGRLAGAFDEMLAELAAASDAQRDFVADASHELRTPLTTLRTNLQLLADDRPLDEATRAALRAAVTEEITAMQATIDDLAELARGDRPGADTLTTVNLVSVVRSSAATAARRWGVSFRVQFPSSDVPVRVADGRLPRLLDVVLDNAGKYGAGEPVDIEVLDGRPVLLSIRDRGIGIPPEDRAHVFDRFHRAASARGLPGSGLGLAIAGQIVAASGGTITAAARGDGPGTEIVITLPAG
jgi:two-component system, OmpR family, sensor histidine kinase MprB